MGGGQWGPARHGRRWAGCSGAAAWPKTREDNGRPAPRSEGRRACQPRAPSPVSRPSSGTRGHAVAPGHRDPASHATGSASGGEPSRCSVPAKDSPKPLFPVTCPAPAPGGPCGPKSWPPAGAEHAEKPQAACEAPPLTGLQAARPGRPAHPRPPVSPVAGSEASGGGSPQGGVPPPPWTSPRPPGRGSRVRAPLRPPTRKEPGRVAAVAGVTWVAREQGARRGHAPSAPTATPGSSLAQQGPGGAASAARVATGDTLEVGWRPALASGVLSRPRSHGAGRRRPWPRPPATGGGGRAQEGCP